MIRVGITGAAGYTAGELIRILVNHPSARIVWAQSESNSGNLFSDVHQGLLGETDMRFSREAALEDVDVVFMCSGHGRSEAFWKEHPCPDGLKIVDLAQDFRDEREGYVYGLPEWQREKIAGASKIANPGCFATCIQLALLPLCKAGAIGEPVSVTAVTGSTGAGVKPGPTTHFSWRNNNISAYKVMEHQHLAEMQRNLSILNRKPVKLDFVPLRGDFARGIFASVTLSSDLSEADAVQLFKDYYSTARFTFVCDSPVDLKEVVNTNKAVLHVEKHARTLVVTSVIDNLLKGASGQAVQNMNLIFGLPEDEGLRLKASAF